MIAAQNHDPLVSVIIATVDRPQFLRRAISSVLANTRADFEIIVTDDAASVVNREVAASFNDSRIRYRSNQTRLGSALNHRRAVDIATGRFIAMLNDDDEWNPDLLDRLLPPLLADPDVVIAFADHYIIDSDGTVDSAATEACTRRWKRDVLAPGLHRPFFALALLDQSVPMVAAIVRRDSVAWDDCPAEVGALYDFWVTYLACRTGAAAFYVNDRLARYRVHSLNTTAVGTDPMLRPLPYIYSRMVDDPALVSIRGPLALRLAHARLAYAVWLIRNGRSREARTYLRPLLLSEVRDRAAAALILSALPSRLAAWILNRLSH